MLPLCAELPKMSGGTVSLVHVAVDGHGAPDSSALLHHANRDRDVIDHAEAFAVIGEGMMKAAADVHADAVLRGPARRPESIRRCAA